jgi:hypothetical protein
VTGRTSGATPYGFTRTTHLVELIAETERTAAALASAHGPARDALAGRNKRDPGVTKLPP